MREIHSTTVPLASGSIRLRLLELAGEMRLDVRRYHGLVAGSGFNVDARHPPALTAGLREVERAALQTDDAQ